MAGNMRPAYLRSKALELICLFTSEMQSVPLAEDLPLSSRERQRIHDLFERVAAAPGEPWRIPDIARDVGMNRNKLTKAFRDSFGFSIYEHVQRSRLHLATKLLKDKDLSIAQIALDVGYSHQSTFTSAFRSVLGVSPLKYRSGDFLDEPR
jgi:AraC-like DNA-binding protein